MNPIRTLKTLFGNLNRSTQLLAEIREGVANMTDVIDRGFKGARGAYVTDRTATVAASAPEPPASNEAGSAPRYVIGKACFIPSPTINLSSSDPIVSLLASKDFDACVAYFISTPSRERALVSPHQQAMLHCMIRNLEPDHVIEVGTFQASTSEAMVRALQINGKGKLHTIDPFGAATVPPIIACWPAALQKHVQFEVTDSMMFFAGWSQSPAKADLIFIDGNHDYEFALFDILSASRCLNPGGLLIVDNIAQPGPFLAVKDFKNLVAGWRELGRPVTDHHGQWPFDRHRPGITNMDCVVLQAPAGITIDSKPYCAGTFRFTSGSFRGFRLPLLTHCSGRLDCQVVLRRFSAGGQTEETLERSMEIDAEQNFDFVFDAVIRVADFERLEVETWFMWHGTEPLKLRNSPESI